MAENDSQNEALTTKQERAAQLLAEDDLTDEAIAAEVEIGARTLWRWKHRPEFAERVKHYRAEFAERVMDEGIARRDKRIQALNRRHRKLLKVIEERAADPTIQHIPGGSTGLIVRRLKVIGTGHNQQVVEEYEVDTGTLRELREHEKQTAQELGQWVEKQNVEGGQRVIVEVVYGDDDPSTTPPA
jgi:hypothetical protein